MRILYRSPHVAWIDAPIEEQTPVQRAALALFIDAMPFKEPPEALCDLVLIAHGLTDSDLPYAEYK